MQEDAGMGIESETDHDWPVELLEILFGFIVDDQELTKNSLLAYLCVSPRWWGLGSRVI